MKNQNRFFLVLLCFLFVSPVFSQPTVDTPSDPDSQEYYYQQLRNQGLDLRSAGTICEAMAQHQFGKLYDPELYRVETGIRYFTPGRTIGELDLIVFRRTDDEAVVIGEVKCWRKLSGARIKALDQLGRFEDWIESDRAFQMRSTSASKQAYDLDQFDETLRYVTVAQKGALESGFDYELDLTLSQAMNLRERIQRCQSRRECVLPE